MRTGEALGLDWRCLDLEHGVLILDENKTDEARDWDLDQFVVEALRAWRTSCGSNAGPDDLVFRLEDGRHLDRFDLASDLRQHLRLAGVDREILFERSSMRRPIRAHDLRATFITIALANGWSEQQIMDKTGHKSSQMIQLYRRRARALARRNIGWFHAMHTSIPELTRIVVEQRVDEQKAGPTPRFDTATSKPKPNPEVVEVVVDQLDADEFDLEGAWSDLRPRLVTPRGR